MADSQAAGLVPVALQVLVVAVNWVLGAPLPTTGQLADSPQVLVTFVVMLVFVIIVMLVVTWIVERSTVRRRAARAARA